MARHWFGGSLTDWAFSGITVDGNDDIPQLQGGVEITFWNLESGGTQYTDLLVDSAAADSVTTSDGGDLEVGAIPAFQGPDGVRQMWADGGNGRYVIVAWDFGEDLADVISQANSVENNLTTHLSSGNPHAVRVRDLDDADSTATGQATDGQVFGYDGASGLWRPVDIEGISGVAQLASEQTFTGKNTFQNADGPDHLDNVAILLPAQAGQVGDLLRGVNASGQRTGYLNEHGELRVIASATNTIAFRVKQRSGSHTANLTEWTTIDYPGAGDILAWVDASGRVRGRNLMVAPWLMSLPGTQEVGPGAATVYNDTGAGLTIRSVRASVGTAPTGADLVVDINRNGSTIFASSGDQPTITDGATTSGKVTSMATTTVNDGDRITIDVDQIGSSTAGSDLVVQLAIY